MEGKGDRKKKESPKAPRKPWVKPKMKTGKLFEVNSLACGKSTGSSPPCLIAVGSS